MKAHTLGEPRFTSHRTHLVSDDLYLPERIEIGADPGLKFEVAAPRAKLFFDAKNTRAGIVTCGGLCPGLNNVIRSLVRELSLGYGMDEVLGFRGGYGGLDRSAAWIPCPSRPNSWTTFTAKVEPSSALRAAPWTPSRPWTISSPVE